MKYLVAVTTLQTIETDAENAEAAIEEVKAKLDPRIAAMADYQIVQETIYNEETKSFAVPIEKEENL